MSRSSAGQVPALKSKKKKKSTEKKKTVKNSTTTVEQIEPVIKKIKKIKHSFKIEYGFYITDKLIFRIREDEKDRDVMKKFSTAISFNITDKVGKRTKHPDGVQRKIIDVITNEKHLVFVVQRILD